MCCNLKSENSSQINGSNIPDLNSFTRGSVGLTRLLKRWYAVHRRDLPWRPPMGTCAPVDPYAVLVSEFMLQQTQVATVSGYFLRFMKSFPTLSALAAASEQDVLRHWQGLGYYSRARNLLAAAKRIEADFAGQIPRGADELSALPGIGRYTAGAISSIAFGRRTAILDGNVARVLCRLKKIQSDPRQPETIKLLWHLAEEILPRRDCGQFNSALMELGATICTPRRPRCPICPVRSFCQAFAAGLQETIPAPRKSRPTPIHARWTLCIRRHNRWLMERRPSAGRWAGLWQFPTVEAGRIPPTSAAIAAQIGIPIGPLRQLGQIRHALTHRRYIFTAFIAIALSASRSQNRKWIRLEDLDDIPLSRPQLKIAEMLQASVAIS
jgi:A/G-specific adenine glycosylase